MSLIHFLSREFLDNMALVYGSELGWIVVCTKGRYFNTDWIIIQMMLCILVRSQQKIVSEEKVFFLHTHTHTHTRARAWAGQLNQYGDWLRAWKSGIESRLGRDFPPVRSGPGAYSASCKMGTGSFPGVKCGRGVLLTTHPLLVPRSWKSRAIPLPTLRATPDL